MAALAQPPYMSHFGPGSCDGGLRSISSVYSEPSGGYKVAAEGDRPCQNVPCVRQYMTGLDVVVVLMVEKIQMRFYPPPKQCKRAY